MLRMIWTFLISVSFKNKNVINSRCAVFSEEVYPGAVSA